MRKSTKTVQYGLAAAGLLCLSTTSFAASVCDAPGNLVQNCGFELGLTSTTVGGSTNSASPPDWTINQEFAVSNGDNQVVSNPVNSGGFALKIGDVDSSPVAAISQSFSDVAGTTYNATFYASYSSGIGADPGASVIASINGSPLLTVGDTNAPGFVPETFTFTGTGTDTLSFAAKTNPGDWYLDDISVQTAPVPLPASGWLLLMALVGMGATAMRRPSGTEPAT